MATTVAMEVTNNKGSKAIEWVDSRLSTAKDGAQGSVEGCVHVCIGPGL